MKENQGGNKAWRCKECVSRQQSLEDKGESGGPVNTQLTEPHLTGLSQMTSNSRFAAVSLYKHRTTAGVW